MDCVVLVAHGAVLLPRRAQGGHATPDPVERRARVAPAGLSVGRSDLRIGHLPLHRHRPPQPVLQQPGIAVPVCVRTDQVRGHAG